MAKSTRKVNPKKQPSKPKKKRPQFVVDSQPKASGKRPAARKSTRAAATKQSLGRPKVTGEELLYMLFKEDYHARQIFDFLRVQTVKDLEEFSPQQIIKRLSQPISETVKRIRQKLAQKNRFLADDIEFARDAKSQAGE